MGAPEDRSQRRFDRYRGRFPARIRLGEETKSGFVTDLSASGLFCECRSTLPAGAQVVLTLDANGEDFSVTGRVAREQRSHRGAASVVSSGFAVQLESAPEAYFEIVADLDRIR
jgi:hypothetical protein